MKQTRLGGAWAAWGFLACAGASGMAATLAWPSVARAQGVETEAPSAPKRLTLAQCAAMAAAYNVDVLAAGEDVESAKAARSGVRGELGPRVRAEASAQRWDGPFTIPFALGGGPPVLFPVRDAFTWNATVSVIQPVSAIFVIYETYKMRELGVDVAALERDVAKRDAAYRAVEAYYRLLQVERLAEVAVASVDQLTAQRKQAESFHDNGVVGKSDVLRAELALASAQQRVIQLRGGVTIARSVLASTLGMRADAAIDAEPIADAPPTRAAVSIEAAEQAATSSRLELRALGRRIEASEKRTGVAWAKLAPQVNLVAQYQHNEGSEFVQKNAAFVGATAAWDVWDWGTTTSGIAEAKAQLGKAQIARRKLEEEVRLEARRAYVNAASAAQAMDVAAAAVLAAEENYRLVTKRYEANAATSFDVVDAEALLTQARGQKQTSYYDYLVARAALARAMGAPPESVAAGR